MFPRLLRPVAALSMLVLAAACAKGDEGPDSGRLQAEEVALAIPAAPLEMPFTLDRNRIVLEVSLNGRDGFPFVLDTGMTDYHLLTRETAATLGLEAQPAGHGYDSAGRRFALEEAVLPNLIVGGLMLIDEPVAIMTLPPAVLTLDAGRRMAGVLGDRLLENFALTLDFAAMKVELSADPPPLPPDAVAVLPLVWSGNLLTTIVLVNGQAELVMVDTGDFHTLTLYDDVAERLGLVAGAEETGEAGHLPVLGAAGPYMLRSTTLDRVEMAGIGLAEMPAAIAPRGTGLPPQISGRLGVGLLSLFGVTLDPANRRMVLVPRTDQHIADLTSAPLQEAER